MAAFPGAYEFESDLSLDEMLDGLVAAGPWQWEARDSDTYGDYVQARPGNGSTRIRIIKNGSGFLLDVGHLDRHPIPRVEVERVIQEEVLPAIGARNVRPASGL